nr:reverse transcriptase domain-containing protein [Tanacetum cinerariifolium]
TRAREAVIGMTWEDFKVLIREKFCPNNKIQKLEAKFWCHTMVGAGHAAYTDRFHELASGEPSRDGNVRDDNNRSRIRSAFATITNPDRKQYNDTTPKCLNCNFHHSPEKPCRSCMNCNRLGRG